MTDSPEAYVQGVSSRSVDDLVKVLHMHGISVSQESRLSARGLRIGKKPLS